MEKSLINLKNVINKKLIRNSYYGFSAIKQKNI